MFGTGGMRAHLGSRARPNRREYAITQAKSAPGCAPPGIEIIGRIFDAWGCFAGAARGSTGAQCFT